MILIIYAIRELKKTVNRDITKLVVTIPAGFNQDQINATRRAIYIATDNINYELYNEPTSSLIYLEKEFPGHLNNNDVVCVIDFGGGTLDIALCRYVNKNEIEHLSRVTNDFLGGNDFDNVMIDILKEKIFEKMSEYSVEPEDFAIFSKKRNQLKRIAGYKRERSTLDWLLHCITCLFQFAP